MKRLVAIPFAVVLSAFFLALDLGAQELPAAEVTSIQREVAEAVERYYSLFSEHQMEALPGDVFHIPWIQVGGGSINPDTTREQALERFEASLAGLLESGWERSVYTTTNVCVVNADMAITSGYNTRYRTDGSVMSVGGVSYILAKSDDGWKIISYTGMPRDKVISCD
ncbi:MAG: hypothetical protein GEU90_19595 [Gemmatimonas sp.]|nr:hypothetical protein [Gemmatimonas sp.]